MDAKNHPTGLTKRNIRNAQAFRQATAGTSGRWVPWHSISGEPMLSHDDSAWQTRQQHLLSLTSYYIFQRESMGKPMRLFLIPPLMAYFFEPWERWWQTMGWWVDLYQAVRVSWTRTDHVVNPTINLPFRHHFATNGNTEDCWFWVRNMMA